MKTRNKKLPLGLLCLGALSQLGVTDCGSILDDSGFDLWCGERLCSWRLDQGTVDRVPTWHQGDDGVRLRDDGTAISQMAPVTSADTSCIRFEALTNIAETATVTLEIDVFGDGDVEYTQVLSTAHWAPVSHRVRLDGPYQGVLFRLSKHGTGEAVLAQIEATVADDCAGAPVALAPRPDGAWCVDADDCGSGTCVGIALPLSPPPVCGECAKDGDCEVGQACGLAYDAPPHLEAYQVCGPPRRHVLGERCAGDAECATSVCEAGVCSTCRLGTTCKGGIRCAVRTISELGPFARTPSQCGPQARGAAAGDACLSGDDCASGTCAGGTLLSVCERDGRTCADDGDCPAIGWEQPGRCIVVGEAGGICD